MTQPSDKDFDLKDTLESLVESSSSNPNRTKCPHCGSTEVFEICIIASKSDTLK